MKVRILIETNESTFALQMSNFISAINDKEYKNILLVRHAQLNEAWLKGHGVTLIRYNKNALSAALSKISDILLQNEISWVSIHTSLSVVSKYIITFLKKIAKYQSVTHLCLYDENISELLISDALNQMSSTEFTKIVDSLGQEIKEIIQGEIPFVEKQWNMVSAYALHKVVKTTYYLQQNSALKKHRKLPVEKISPLRGSKLKDFLNLYNTSPNIYESLLRAKSSALLLIGTVPFVEDDVLQHQQKFINVVNEAMRSSDEKRYSVVLYRDGEGPLFNGHDIKLEQGSVLKLPDYFTVNLLKVLDILPDAVAGAFSDELLQSPKQNITFTVTTDALAKVDDLIDKLKLNIPQPIYFDDLQDYRDVISNTRIFYCPASMGDVIYALGSINALRKEFNEKVIFIAHPLYRGLVESCPVVDEFWDMFNYTKKKQNILKIIAQHGFYHNIVKWEHFTANEHLTDVIIADVKPGYKAKDKHAVFSLGHVENKKITHFIEQHELYDNKVVLLHPNYGAPNRTWTEEGWHFLAEKFLSEGWKVVIIGSDNNKYREKTMMSVELPGVISAVNHFSILETVLFMQHCQLLVACDSGPVGLAGMTDIAICALYSIIPAQYRLPYRHGQKGWNALGIDRGCEYGQCGHLIMDAQFFKKELNQTWTHPDGDSFAKWCPNDDKYMCMRKMSPEYLWGEIRNFLNSDNYVAQ